MLFRVLISVYYENYTKHKYIVSVKGDILILI
jgi:hypothetical protein